GHLVARFVCRDVVGDVFGAGDLLAVDAHDDVAADGNFARFAGRGRAAFDAGLVGGGAGLDAGHERGGLAGQAPGCERAGQGACHEAEVAGGGGAAFLELADLGLGGVDRYGEADADAAVAAAARLDLGVDADHAPVGVEQRPTGVARVDRGVG